MDLDEVDRKLILHLVKDGRATLKELSDVIGYTSMGVKKRLNRLLKQKLLRVSASVNLDKMNWVSALIFMEVVDKDSMYSILNRFRECPRVVWFFPALGGYNLIAFIVAEDYRTLHCISSEGCSMRGLNGVRRIEFYPISGILYEPFIPLRLNLAYRNLDKPPCGIECPPCRSYIEGKCVGCPATKFYRYRWGLGKRSRRARTRGV